MEIIVFGDIISAISFRRDVQQSFVPHISRMQEDIQMYRHSSIDENYSDQFGKLLLQMYNNTKMLIANGVSLWSKHQWFYM